MVEMPNVVYRWSKFGNDMLKDEWRWVCQSKFWKKKYKKNNKVFPMQGKTIDNIRKNYKVFPMKGKTLINFKLIISYATKWGNI